MLPYEEEKKIFSMVLWVYSKMFIFSEETFMLRIIHIDEGAWQKWEENLASYLPELPEKKKKPTKKDEAL